MENKQFIFLVLILLSFVSCTEKVAKELEETSTGGSTTPPPVVLKKFSVDVIKPVPDDSIVMHLANYGPSVKCNIETVSLDTANPAVRDCVIDVNEYELYSQGFTLNIEATDNLCEYIGVSPQRFYTYAPGSSSGSYTVHECSPEWEDPANNCDAGDGVGVCPAGTPPPANACAFNYGDNYKCDTGSHTITTIQHAWDSANSTCTAESSIETVECGGDDLNCVAMPDSEVLAPAEKAYWGKVYKADYILKEQEDESLAPVATYEKSIEFTAPYDSQREDGQPYNSNMILANFSKNCSGVDPSSSNGATGLNLSYLSQTGYIPYNTTDPKEIILKIPGDPGWTAPEFYRYNISEPVTIGTVSGTAFAASSFRGIHARPLYTVRCLDQAHDVKAEIRFVVREWDKRFEPGTEDGMNVVTWSDGSVATDTGAFELWWNQFWDADDLIEAADLTAGAPNPFGSYCYGGLNTTIPGFDPNNFIGNNL